MIRFLLTGKRLKPESCLAMISQSTTYKVIVMCIKVDNTMSKLKIHSEKGLRWGDLDLVQQQDAIWVLYNDNKKYYDDKTRGSSNNGKMDMLIDDLYRLYDFLDGKLISKYDDKEAPQGDL